MGKRYFYLIVLTLFCLVEKIKTEIFCQEVGSHFLHDIKCVPGNTKEHNITMKEIEVAWPNYHKKEDVLVL